MKPMGARTRLFAAVGAALCLLAALFLACGGDDAAAPAPASDASPEVGPIDDRRDAGPTEDSSPDAERDAAPRRCDPAKPFGPREPVTELNSPQSEQGGVSFTEDQLVAIVGRTGGIAGSIDMYEATRPNTSVPFGTLRSVPTNTSSDENHPQASADGLTLYFSVPDPIRHLFFATRGDRDAGFGNAQKFLNVNRDPYSSQHAWITRDERTLYYSSNAVADGAAETAIEVATRASKGVSFGAGTFLSGLHAAPYSDGHPAVTADEREIYFTSTRPGSAGGEDIWVARRASPTASFDPPSAVAELNTSASDRTAWISGDGCEIYLTSNVILDAGPDGATDAASANFDIYRARRPQ
jgi:hypothetical protein